MRAQGSGDEWRRWVVYQIYPRSFADSDGDGIGDLRGVIDRLDHLVKLGVDVLWLSPIYRSPMDDNGYDISDYRDVDPVFGSLDDLDELISALHDRGIKLVMDLVVNHTSDEHPWFLASRSSRGDPKRDWYWWRQPRSGAPAGTPGSEPNNWSSFFSGSAWTWDEGSEQFYLHLFSRKQPDLNWENPDVRAAVYEMMRWWLDRGVDGFRMDVINMISKDTNLPDARPQPGSRYGSGYRYFICGPRNHEMVQEMCREVFAGRRSHVLTIGETPGATVADAVLFTDPERGELDMIFQFDHVSLDYRSHRYDPRPLDLVALKRVMASWQEGLRERGWNSLYWGNHDQPRAVSRFGSDAEHRIESAKTLATVLHLHRGTPFIYQGDELGMANAPFRSVEEFRDIETLNFYAAAQAAGDVDLAVLLAEMNRMSRDQGRTPMQWDSSPNAGFTSGIPWIGVNPDHEIINAEAQVDDPVSVFSHHRHLIELRHTDPVITDGSFALLLQDHTQLWSFIRESADGRILVAANCSDQIVEQTVDPYLSMAGASVLISTHGAPLASLPGLRLRPWESIVWRWPGPPSRPAASHDPASHDPAPHDDPAPGGTDGLQ